MASMTRREHMKGLGLTTLSCLSLRHPSAAAALGTPLGAGARAAQETPIPPQGIGRRIRYLSYSDQGRPP